MDVAYISALLGSRRVGRWRIHVNCHDLADASRARHGLVQATPEFTRREDFSPATSSSAASKTMAMRS